jgi:hypothetical protein
MLDTQSRTPPTAPRVVIETLDEGTGTWEAVHELVGTYDDGKTWYLEHGHDEQAYRVVEVHPPHRVLVEKNKRRLVGMEG